MLIWFDNFVDNDDDDDDDDDDNQETMIWITVLGDNLGN